MDVSASSSGIYEKIQSIQSYSVQSLEDEERILLKSIQYDVFFAIQKYQTKLKKTQSTLKGVLRQSKQSIPSSTNIEVKPQPIPKTLQPKES
jgi:hypothetical protein